MKKLLIEVLTSVLLVVCLSNLAFAGGDGTEDSTNDCGIEVAFDYEVDDLTVTFTNTSLGNYDLIEWSFGDTEGETEVTSSDDNPVHKYKEEGMYTFCLTATNTEEGCTQKFCGQLYVFK